MDSIAISFELMVGKLSNLIVHHPSGTGKIVNLEDVLETVYSPERIDVFQHSNLNFRKVVHELFNQGILVDIRRIESNKVTIL